ncbi:MAG: ABC transporter permease [Oscillospiraceae bacterium]|nr:ABC transporter permease [Oscillospiraceae bacterium]
MVKYLNAELYKVRHRAYPLGFLAVVLGGISALFLLVKLEGNLNVAGEDMGYILGMALIAGLYLVVPICDMVFSDQYKFNTLKNEVSYGLPRLRIYFGKLASAAIMSVLLCAIIVGYYLMLSLLLFPLEGELTELLRACGEQLLQALPLWLGGLGLFQALLFTMKGSTSATVVYFLVVGMLDSVLKLLALLVPSLMELAQRLLSCLLQTPFNSTALDIPHAWLVGMGWLIASTVVGAVVFLKREIN